MSDVSDLDQLGKYIAAEIKTARRYEAAAKEKAGVDLQKADNHWTAATLRLAEARKVCAETGQSFKDFKEKYAPDLSRATLYRVIAIGSGKLTIEEQRKEWREEKREKRAAKNVSQTKLSETAQLALPEPQPAEKPEPEQPGPGRITLTKSQLMAIVKQIAPLYTHEGDEERFDVVPDGDLELYDALLKASEILRDLAQHYACPQEEWNARFEAEKTAKTARKKELRAEQKATQQTEAAA